MECRQRITLVTTLLGLAAIGVVASIHDRGGGVRLWSDPGRPSSGGVPDPAGLPAWVIENLFTVILGLAALFVVALAAYLLVVRRLEGLHQIARSLALAAVMAVGGSVLYFGIFALILYFSSGSVDMPGGAEGIGGRGGGEGGSPGAAVTGETATAGFIAVAVLCIAGVLLYFMLQRDRGPTTVGGYGGTNDEPTVSDETGDVAPTFDIADVPTSNAVYRAWREMATTALDGADRTVTANEVAMAADRSGFDREAVDGLTELFEAVRYGNKPITDDREQRARQLAAQLDDSDENSDIQV